MSPNRRNRAGRCAKLAGVTTGLTSEKVRVVVGDDHPMFRDGVVRALVSSGSIEVVAEADDGPSALEAIRTHLPQVALLDYRMPGMDGAEVAAAVLRDELPTRVLLVSAHDESAIVFKRAAGGRRRISTEGIEQVRTGERGAGLRQGPRCRGARAWLPDWPARSADVPSPRDRC